MPGPEVPPAKQEQPKRPRRAAKRLKAAQVAELVEAYKSGATTYQLAERFGIKRQTVSDNATASHLDGVGSLRQTLTELSGCTQGAYQRPALRTA